jgi:hypothetical protein
LDCFSSGIYFCFIHETPPTSVYHFASKIDTPKYDEQMSYLCGIIIMAGRSPLANCSPMQPR